MQALTFQASLSRSFRSIETITNRTSYKSVHLIRNENDLNIVNMKKYQFFESDF